MTSIINSDRQESGSPLVGLWDLIKESGVDITKTSFAEMSDPLAVIWYLIKKSTIDITEVSISYITEQYINYLRLMETLNMHIASEFILMASELLYYKSRSLLPSGDIDDEYFTPPMPPELIQKLLEYKKFQQSSMRLKDAYDSQVNVYSRLNSMEGIDGVETVYREVSLFDLLKAFAHVMDSSAASETEREEIVFDEILVSDRIEYIASFLQDKESVIFTDLFITVPRKAEIIASIMAVLEMVKTKMIKVLQEQIFGEIVLVRHFSSDNPPKLSSVYEE